MQSANDLKQLLFSINHKSYPAYKSTRGAYQFPRYTLSIDHVQGDPFAAPSRVSVHVSGKTAAFPAFLYDTYEKRVALQDYLLRQFARAIAPYSFRAKGFRQKWSAGDKPLRTGNSGAHCLRSESFRRQSCRQHGNRLSSQRPHHRLAGADPYSFRLSARLRGKNRCSTVLWIRKHAPMSPISVRTSRRSVPH